MKFSNMMYYKPLVQIREVLSQKTKLEDIRIFNNLINFYISQMASNMRAVIVTQDRGTIPINFYGISTATSGAGKGYSNYIMTNSVVGDFRKEFIKRTLPFFSELYLERLAKAIANTKNSSFDDELETVKKEYDTLGAFIFSFDSGTLAGMKQLRQKLLMGKIGALSFIVDEIGSNLLDPSVMDIIKGFLELYDMGQIGDKLLKSSKDAKRNTMFTGASPANMLLYGTPHKVYDGGVVEKTFRQLLTVGMARRSFFAHSNANEAISEDSAETIFNKAIESKDSKILRQYSNLFKSLADRSNFRKKINMPRSCSLLLIEYEQYCKAQAAQFNERDSELIAELQHSYFKVLKLSGAYAFADGLNEVNKGHVEAAILCGLESSRVFKKYVITQPKPHERLLKYLSLLPKNQKVTIADLKRDLPFFPTATNGRIEIMKLAASYGFTNNIALIHEVEDDIDLYSVKMLQPTDIEEMIVSYSDKISRDYQNIILNFNDLDKMVSAKDVHWVNHHLDEGVRDEDHCIPGFNMVVLDIDIYVDLQTVQLTFSDYQYLMYTTKSHTSKKHRYRIVLPVSHEVELSADDFVRFMDNLFEWLPFDVDRVTNQRSRKWLSNNGDIYENKGKLLDVHLFIPKNSKAVRINNINADLENISALEKWFIRQVAEGAPRNNTLLKYALVLVDRGQSVGKIMRKVENMNDNFNVPKSSKNLTTTIAVTVAKRVAKRDM